ncbi:hypothetical protein A943_02585 [Bacillus sp. CPSM8]|nr:hypothetical protein A943_02585 [Bacillus sp. CPSM8]OLG08642.1 Aspartokinase [Bacillus paralicheniformis]
MKKAERGASPKRGKNPFVFPAGFTLNKCKAVKKSFLGGLSRC